MKKFASDGITTSSTVEDVGLSVLCIIYYWQLFL